MRTIQPAPLLKFALFSDALVTAALAAIQLLLLDFLTELLALPRALLLGSGLFMVAYAGFLALLLRGGAVWQALVMFVVVGNIGWAVGCVAILVGGAVAPNELGAAFLALHAGGVLVFAGMEYLGLRASRVQGADGMVVA